MRESIECMLTLLLFTKRYFSEDPPINSLISRTRRHKKMSLRALVTTNAQSLECNRVSRNRKSRITTKSAPVRNVRSNTVQILAERLERERAREEEEMNTTICLAVPRRRDLGQRSAGSGGRHVCEVCDKDFSSAYGLKTHKRIHTGEKPFKCRECDKAFSDKSHLTRHTRIHTGEKPFKCEVCDKAFSDKSNLTVHLRTHTGEKPYQCHVCEKAFAEFSTLVSHVRVHTDLRPFKCDCGKAYKDRSGLSYHKRTQKH